MLLYPSPSLVLPLPRGGGGNSENPLLSPPLLRGGGYSSKSSPSLWEGEDIGGGGSIFYFVTELIG
ncbi:MAG: hypothetical protein B5M48_04580 [Candidatus Omnitrophica bacterium 4484_213]|nr:MAG: hypothetical protein B5M48_04580 [Candidatus Omnitrophica bacterium 4484_213]